MSEALIKETYDALLAAARGALAQGASFAPFGAAAYGDGRRTLMTLDEAAQARAPEVQGRIALLASALRQETAAGLACAGIAFDGAVRVKGGEQVPALCMHIEVRGGEALEAFVPYVREPQGLALLDPIFAPTEPEVFTAGAGQGG